MNISFKEKTFAVDFFYERENAWIPIPSAGGEGGMHEQTERKLRYCVDGAEYTAEFTEGEEGQIRYALAFSSPWKTQLRMRIAPAQHAEEGEAFHVIPCNIFGDNNAAEAVPGEFPLLTFEHPEVSYCSPRFEYRADRAAMPLSAVCLEDCIAAVSIAPYSENGAGAFLHNGIFCELPAAIGVSLGYTNDPCSMKNKRLPQPSTCEKSKTASASGTLYCVMGGDRRGLHRIIRSEYMERHERAFYSKSLKEAAEGLLHALTAVNWDSREKEYTNRKCSPPADMELKPWRSCVEIGWTGGGVLSYSLVLVRDVLGSRAEEMLRETGAMSGETLTDRITAGYHPESGLYCDLMTEWNQSRVNGWWAGFGLVRDCHCAYTNGSALHYILKTIRYLKQQGKAYPETWLRTAEQVMDTVIRLQREDGAYGYTYAYDRREVLDWNGFAGCWFAACAAYCYELTGEAKYLISASKAMDFYGVFVRELRCAGTPMDTWKSVDEEGNLAFIRASRILHEITGDERWLGCLRDGADFEFLWRYGYRARPDHIPLRAEYSGWNSCGGSVTSVSNPHIHPMAAIINEDLLYLGGKTGDTYYTERAKDGLAWLMQTLELYPEKTGYGSYGVLSERWCPSDGLTVERFSDGRPYSSWFSYNLWAAANALENICEAYLRETAGGDRQTAGNAC